MSGTGNTDVEKGQMAEPREDIIKTAIKFLQNPHVFKSPLAQSQKFLQSKGLTDQEIQIACERSGAYNIHYFNEKPPCLPPALPQQVLMHPHQTLFYKIRDTLQSVAIFTSVGYIIYLFYKRFIRPWFSNDAKKKTVEESISDLNKTVTESVNDLRDNLVQVKAQIDRINDQEETTAHSQLQELKNEISTVKGLLLNRKQFPSVPGVGLVPPSIPAWQLSSLQPSSADHGPEGDAESKAEDMLEIGSGSGSSETEVVTKNSDSSLEIM